MRARHHLAVPLANTLNHRHVQAHDLQVVDCHCGCHQGIRACPAYPGHPQGVLCAGLGHVGPSHARQTSLRGAHGQHDHRHAQAHYRQVAAVTGRRRLIHTCPGWPAQSQGVL